MLSPPNQVGNPAQNQLASNGFSPLARWELLKVEEESIPLEDELEVGGIKYCAPTVPREEFERTGVGGGGQKKYNYRENFDRPTYSKKVELPKLNQRGNIMRNKETNDVMYEMQETNESVPNMEFLQKHA